MAERQPTSSPATPVTPAKSRPAPRPEDPTIGKLVSDLSKDVSTLVSKEIELAKSELKLNVKFGGVGAALFGVAAFMLLISVIILSITVAFLIHLTGLNLAWCFGIVFLFYVLVALLLAFLGYRSVKKVRGLPRTIEQAKATSKVLKR